MQNTEVSKLIRVRAVQQSAGDYKYVGYFEDGSVRTLRRSANNYISVAQVRTYGQNSDQCDFLFSAKLTPSLRSFERQRLVTTLPIGAEAALPAAEPAPVAPAPAPTTPIGSRARKVIPADEVPERAGKLVARWHFKVLYHVYDDVWFIGYYNCGIHFQSWEEARAKYNELKAVAK